MARAISRSRRCFQRAGSVSSWVPPVGRASWGLMPLAARPHGDFADEGAVVRSRYSPDWLSVTLAGVILDLVGAVRRSRPAAAVSRWRSGGSLSTYTVRIMGSRRPAAAAPTRNP
jgi:hypothetical protein